MTEWALAHPWLTFFFVAFALSGLAHALTQCAVLVNRTIRHLNIRKAGWPPPHVDADGDALPR